MDDDNSYQRKQATLYDAVAGRVGYKGFLTEQQASRYRDTTMTSTSAIPPDEVLFRRAGAPIRYAERDVYEADRFLHPHQKLPDSDLLKTIHPYVADFYGSNVTGGSGGDTRSLDETALLAIGILLEEAAAEALGRTGDLALVQPSDRDPNATLINASTSSGHWRGRVGSHTKT